MTAILARGEIREDPRETDFIDEYADDAEKDRSEIIAKMWTNLRELAAMLRHGNVTYCDAGTGRDIVALIEQLRPHPADRVEAHARLVARDEWDV